MRRLLLALCVVVAFVATANAQTIPANGVACPGSLSVLGGGIFASMTITNSAAVTFAASISPAPPDNAKCFVGVIEFADARYIDGTATPSAGTTLGSAGVIITNKSPIIIPANSFGTIKFIATSSTSSALQGHFYK